MLPLGNPDKPAARSRPTTTSTSPRWPGRCPRTKAGPGHELQFTAMVERGVSLARTLFAFNSVNVEGWALYAEAEMVPYEPLDGQLIALQFRLLRAARAMLDPMLNLGLTDRDTRSAGADRRGRPVERRWRGRNWTATPSTRPARPAATSTATRRILELRMETELALGDKFDRMAFNNFLLDQGLLPPDLLAKAVREEFVPAQRPLRH